MGWMDSAGAEEIRLQAVGMRLYTAPAARVPPAAALIGPAGPIWRRPFGPAGRTTSVVEWAAHRDAPDGPSDEWTPKLFRLRIAPEDDRHLRPCLGAPPAHVHGPPELAVGWDHSHRLEGRPWGAVFYRCHVAARRLGPDGEIELLLETLGHPAHAGRHAELLGRQ
jgi:hypothetical protein